MTKSSATATGRLLLPPSLSHHHKEGAKDGKESDFDSMAKTMDKRNKKKRGKVDDQGIIVVEDENSPTPLPVLSKKGVWKIPKKAESNDMSIQLPDSDDADEDHHDESPEIPPTQKIKSAAEIKSELASISLAITEESGPRIPLEKLSQIRQYCNYRVYPQLIVQMALLTTAAIFKDVIPGYRIRPSTPTVAGHLQKQEAKLQSAAVQQTRKFETALLHHYQAFLNILKPLVDHRRPLSAKHRPVTRIAIKCIEELLKCAGHFNYFEELLKMAMNALWSSESENVCAISAALRSLFDRDQEGKSTKTALALLSDMCSQAEYDFDEEWLKAVETVRFANVQSIMTANSRINHHLGKDKRKKLSARQDREAKEASKKLAVLAEAEETINVQERLKWSSEGLRSLFRIYFGVLKRQQREQLRAEGTINFALLTHVFAGLQRHAHRIDIEYFADLLTCLRSLLDKDTKKNGKSLNKNSKETSLLFQCILCIDRIYSLNENLASMDLKFVYNAFYRELRNIQCSSCLKSSKKTDASAKEEFDLRHTNNVLDTASFLNVIKVLFTNKRNLPQIRTCSIIQRILDIVLEDMAPCITTTLLSCIHSILLSQPKARTILDREPFGQGSYQRDCHDPDLAYPLARPIIDTLEELKRRANQTNSNSMVSAIVGKIISLAP